MSSSLRFLRLTSLLTTAGFALTSPTHAKLRVYEGFDGYEAGQLADQKPNDNTIGLDTTVGYYDGKDTSRAGNYTLQEASLTFGNLQTRGGALAFTTGTNVIGADLAIGDAFEGTLWSSYLIRLTSINNSSAGNGAVVRIGTKPSTNEDAHFNSWADSRTSGTASPNVSIGYDNAQPSTNNGTGSLANDTTYIIINRFTNVGRSGTGVATLWALNADQFGAFLEAGGDETALEGTSVTATAEDTATGTYTFTSSQSYGLITVNDAGVYDELRFGSTLADVTPIPEPATTAAVAGLAGALLCVIARSRRPKLA